MPYIIKATCAHLIAYVGNGGAAQCPEDVRPFDTFEQAQAALAKLDRPLTLDEQMRMKPRVAALGPMIEYSLTQV